MSTNVVLVIGHRNPDTDAIASAVGYAWLLNATRNDAHEAGRPGQLNAQTSFALERFKLDPPALFSDIHSRIADVTQRLPSLRQGQTLLEACQMIAQTQRPAPLLDEADRPLGLLTGEGLFAHLAEALSSTSVLALAKEFDLPAASAVDAGSITLREDEFVRDVLPGLLRTEQDDFIVTDGGGRYIGLCRKSALLSPPKRRIVMVDHNELGQAVPGLEEAEVIEVIDHHRLSGLPTTVPIRIQIEPVGSCSTLVAERAEELEQRFPAEIAGLLLCGILSDTLIFRSPTATARDREAALWLAAQAELTPSATPSEEALFGAIEALGADLLAAGAGLGLRPIEDIISSDIKFYEAGGHRVGIAQVEVTSFSELVSRLEELRHGLSGLLEREKLALALLMITDVVRGNSRFVVVGQPRLIAALPYARHDEGVLDAPGVVSRKKQLLPAVLNALSQLASA